MSWHFGFTVTLEQFKRSNLFYGLMHLGTKVRHIYCGRKTTLAPPHFEAQRKQMKGEVVSTQGSKSLLVKGTEKNRSFWPVQQLRMWKQETLETLQSASKPEQSSLFVANEPWCFLIIYKPFKWTWWENRGSQSKCFYLERDQKTPKCFVKWANNELLPTTEQELSKTARGSQGLSDAWIPKALFSGRLSF